jgi:antitoxin MazE
LKINPDAPLDVSTDGERLIISPVQPGSRREKFEAAQAWTHERYGAAFKKLA